MCPTPLTFRTLGVGHLANGINFRTVPMMKADAQADGLFPIRAGKTSELMQQDEEKIMQQLTALVRHLMAHAPEQLSRAAYRMDLDERLFYQALAEKDAANAVAHLIFERQWRSALSRKRFKGKEKGTDDDLLW